MKRFISIIAFILVGIVVGSDAGHGQSQNNFKPGEVIQNIIPMRERVQMMERWWEWKKENVLPMIMREHSVDLWIIRDNEADLYYDNEGPVYTSLPPANFQEMTFPSTIVPEGLTATYPLL